MMPDYKQSKNAVSLKFIAKAMGKDIFPETKLKKKRNYTPREKRTTPNKHEEKDLQRAIINTLRAHGAICGKVKAEAGVWNNIRLKSNLLFTGVPDILCFFENKQFWIEVKTSTGRLSDDQIVFQKLCQSANICHLIIRDIKEIVWILNEKK